MDSLLCQNIMTKLNIINFFNSSLVGQVSYYLGPYPEIMGSLFIWISKMAVSSSQKFSQRFLKEIYFSGVQAFF